MLFEDAVAALNLPDEITENINEIHSSIFDEDGTQPQEIKKDWDTKIIEDGGTTTITAS